LQEPLTVYGFTNVTLNTRTIIQDYTHQNSYSVPLTVVGWANQATNLFEARDYANNLKAAIDANGNIIANGISGITGLVTNNYSGASFTTPFSLNSPHFNGIVQFNSNDNGAVTEDFFGYLNIRPNPGNGGGLVMWGNRVSFASTNAAADAYIYFDTSSNLVVGADNPANFVLENAGFTNAEIMVPLTVDVSSPTNTPLRVAGANGQTADLQQWQAANFNIGQGTVLARVDANGVFYGNGTGLTNLNGAALQAGTVNSNALDTATRQLLGQGGNVRSGVATIGSFAVTAAATFSSPLPNTNYAVVATPEFNTGGVTWWVNGKTTNGFNFNLAAGVSGGGRVSWQAVSDQ
jgi:hypothetical protein